MQTSYYARPKPFIKWAGGKGQLITQLESLLPEGFGHEITTYVEPFVGGGAMLFYLLQKYPKIKTAAINDINPDLVDCYQTVRDNPVVLISLLHDLQDEYYNLHNEEVRRECYLRYRDKFNEKTLSPEENAALFIFLNRTCFNGLYRVNKGGKFNVPFGKAVTPTICDEKTIWADSELLQKVEILQGDFERTIKYASPDAFFYFDPPYRPLNETSNFNDYAKETFDDGEQQRLKLFCDKLNSEGVKFMLSNADCKGKSAEDTFLDDLYKDYCINRVWAKRMINANPEKRGKLTEIVVSNFSPRAEITLFD